jgi:hypothetical protein
MLANPTSPVSLGGDAIAISFIPLSWMGYLTPAATILTLIWVGLQIYTWVVNKNWQPKITVTKTVTSIPMDKEPKDDR